MKTHHVCYEGTLACSGCNPCAHCLDVVNREVLAQAMRRTTEAIAQARGPEGIVQVKELDTRNFWAVFYGYYGEAWRNLHAAMMSDPKVSERAYDLRDIPGFTSTGRYVPPVPAVFPPSPLPVMPPPSAVMPLSALAAQVSAPSTQLPPLPGTKQINGDGAHIQEMDITSAYPQQAHGAAAMQAVDAGPPWVTSFSLRETAAETASRFEGGRTEGETDRLALLNRAYGKELGGIETASPTAPADVETESKLVIGPAGPADIRRAITADDIAASATVLDAAAPATPPSANGLAARD